MRAASKITSLVRRLRSGDAGLPGIVPATSSRAWRFPTINVTDFNSLAGSPADPAIRATRGRCSHRVHAARLASVQAGRGGPLIRGNFFRNTAPSGSFSFGPIRPADPTSTRPAGGFALASFLFGYGSGSIPSTPASPFRTSTMASICRTTGGSTPRLTLNLGLRWEYEIPRTERYDRTTRGFAFGAPEPDAGAGSQSHGRTALCRSGRARPRASMTRTATTSPRASASRSA